MPSIDEALKSCRNVRLIVKNVQYEDKEGKGFLKEKAVPKFHFDVKEGAWMSSALYPVLKASQKKRLKEDYNGVLEYVMENRKPWQIDFLYEKL